LARLSRPRRAADKERGNTVVASFDFTQDEEHLTMASAIFLILSEVEGRILLVQGA